MRMFFKRSFDGCKYTCVFGNDKIFKEIYFMIVSCK